MYSFFYPFSFLFSIFSVFVFSSRVRWFLYCFHYLFLSFPSSFSFFHFFFFHSIPFLSSSLLYIRRYSRLFPNLPPLYLNSSGMHDPNIRQAWREKLALVTIIIFLCGAVGFLTFGFQLVLCGTQTGHVQFDQILSNQVIINGRAYTVDKFKHPVTANTNNVIASSGNLLDAPTKAGGADLSFLFQNTDGACRGLLTTTDGANKAAGGNLLYFFPCLAVSSNTTAQSIGAGWVNPSPAALAACHNPGTTSRGLLSGGTSLPIVDVFYSWDNLTTSLTSGGKLFIFNGYVIHLHRNVSIHI